MTEDEIAHYKRNCEVDAQLAKAAFRRLTGRDMPSQEEFGPLPLATKAYWNGIGKAVSWETDYKHLVNTLTKNTDFTRSEALQFCSHLELVQIRRMLEDVLDR